MLYSIFHYHQIPLHDRSRQQEFLFHAAKAYRDHIGLDGCYRANAKRLMLDLDTNLDFGNIHLDRRFWLSSWLAVQTKARLCSSNAATRTHRAWCKAAGGTGSRAGCIAVARLVDSAAGSLCALRRVDFGRKSAKADDGFRGLRCRIFCGSRFWLVLVRGKLGLCRQVVRGGRRGFHRCLLQGEHLVVIGIRKHRIPAAAVFALMTVNAGIA